MRTRKKIENDGLRPEFLILEALLDIRDLTIKQNKTKKAHLRVRDKEGK